MRWIPGFILRPWEAISTEATGRGGYNSPGEEDKSWYPPHMVIVTFLFQVRITDVLS